jgi:hypothetical protein
MPGFYGGSGWLRSPVASISFDQIAKSIQQPGVFAVPAGIFFEDVEEEIIKPAPGPNSDQKKPRCSKMGAFDQDQNAGGDAQKGEEQAFKMEQFPALEVVG